MMRLLILYLLFYTTMIIGQNKKICISVDDLPTVTYSLNTNDMDLLITNSLINTFTKNNVPAIGYVNESKLYKKGKLNPKKVHLLDLWLKNGLDLGNHTFSHIDYNKVADSTFFKDIFKGEHILKPLMSNYGKTLKYFRHPYLHTGSDSLSYSKLNTFLIENNYQTSPVTIDNDDYLFAKAYHNAYKNKDQKLMNEIGEKYVIYMEQKLLYFESKSIALFNKSIPQTLLIHANLLNANYMDKLVKMIQKNGYNFVSQEDALKTPEYATKISWYTQYGISWMFRWGMSLGKTKNLRLGDIETPKDIIKLANE